MHIPDFKKSYQGLCNACVYVSVCKCVHMEIRMVENGRCQPSGLLSASSETGPFIGLELPITQRQGFLASESHGSTCLSLSNPEIQEFSTMHGFWGHCPMLVRHVPYHWTACQPPSNVPTNLS